MFWYYIVHSNKRTGIYGIYSEANAVAGVAYLIIIQLRNFDEVQMPK